MIGRWILHKRGCKINKHGLLMVDDVRLQEAESLVLELEVGDDVDLNKV
jgi:hypothetical protein